MISIFSLFRLNVQGQGSVILWAGGDSPLSDSEIDSLLPQSLEDLYGPNLAINAVQLSARNFLICTTSRWDITDQFGRRGPTLSQGFWLNCSGDNDHVHIELCELFLTLSDIHEKLFVSLGKVLQRIATVGEEEERVLADRLHDLLASRVIRLESGTCLWLQKATEHLTEVSGQEKLRLFSDFQDSKQLGTCLLLGLLVKMPLRSRIGGGYLKNSASYQHIASSQDTSGFSAQSLGKLLSSRPKKSAISFKKVTLSSPEVPSTKDPSQLTRRRDLLRSSWMILVLALAVGYSGWLIIKVQASVGRLEENLRNVPLKVQSLIERFDSLASEKAHQSKGIDTNGTDPAKSPAATDLKALIDDLFIENRRDTALIQLTSRSANDPHAIESALYRAENSLGDSNDQRMGLVYLLRFLATAGEQPLKNQKVRIEALLEKVESLRRPMATEAARTVAQRL